MGEAAKHQVAGGKVENFAHQRSRRTQQRPANADHRFDPGVARRFLQEDHRANKGNKHGRAYFETESFGGQQVSAFVDEYQQDKSDGKPNSPSHGVNPNGEDHGAAGFEQHREEFQHRDKGNLELGEERHDGHADRSQRLLQFLAEAGRRRRRKTIRRIFILIHGGMLPDRAGSASPNYDCMNCWNGWTCPHSRQRVTS